MNASTESRRIENILASISDCFYALDVNYRFIYINPQTEAYLGKTRDELLGRHIRDVFPAIAGTVFEREFARVIEHGGKSNFIGRSVLTDKWIDVTIYAQPRDVALSDGGGGVAVYFRDVTESRQNRRALIESEERLRSVSEATDTALWVLDFTNDKVLYQLSLEQLFGFPIKSLNEMIARVHPDDLAQIQSAIDQAVSQTKGYEVEFRIMKVSGHEVEVTNPEHWKWLSSKVSVKRGKQGEVLFFGVNRDISLRKLTELALQDSREQLDLIIEESGMLVWRWHPDKDEIIYQKNMEAFYPQVPESYRDILTLVHPDDIENIRLATEMAIKDEHSSELQYRVARYKNADPTREEDWRWVENRSNAVGSGSNLQFYGFIIDITKRKNEERALQLTQERLQTVAIDSGFSFCVWDHEKDVFIEKFMFDEFYGYPVNSFSELNTRIHPDDLPGIRKQIALLVTKGGRVDIEYRVLRAGTEQADPANEAQWRHILCKLSRHSKAGEPAILYAFNYDMTVQKEVEAQLRITQTRLENLSSQAGIALWVWEPERDLLHNKYLLDETFGFEVKSWKDVLTHLHPDDIAPTKEVIDESIKTQQSKEIEYRIRRFEGADLRNVEDWKTYLVKISPSLLPDGHTLLYGFNIDISQNRIAQEKVRQSELRFRSLVQANSTAVWRADAKGKILLDNISEHDFFGLTASSASGLQWLEDVHPDDREETRRLWEYALKTGTEYLAEYRVGDREKYRWIRARGVPVLAGDNQVIEWIGTLDDINDARIASELREQIFNQEREARLVAEAASRTKDEFLAIVSHELRTPLNAILGWSHLIRTGGLPEEVAKNGLEVIERNARAQAQIVEDILDVARIVTGKLTIDFKAIDLQAIATEAIESVSAIAAQKGVRLQSELISVSVLGDSTRLRQVLWNLLTNAIKFTPEGGDVSISLYEQGGYAKVVVRDSGIGISPEFLPQIFDRFQQADSSSTRRHGGLGLGLALVRSLVEAHNGTVTARSDGENKGAVFEVYFPLCEPEKGLSSSASVSSSEQRLMGVNILVVDDAPDTLELIRILLQRDGAKTTSVLSSEEARRILLTNHYDLVLTDLAMPDEDGYTLLKWIKQNNQKLPVVAMTAFAGIQERERCLSAGFNEFLGKPIEIDKLVKTILEALGKAENPMN
jgi:PAS domain S-box-containing protein